jgi:hypothetical protein
MSQQLAGHEDISTTRKYCLAVRSEDLATANKVFDGFEKTWRLPEARIDKPRIKGNLQLNDNKADTVI